MKITFEKVPNKILQKQFKKIQKVLLSDPQITINFDQSVPSPNKNIDDSPDEDDNVSVASYSSKASKKSGASKK